MALDGFFHFGPKQKSDAIGGIARESLHQYQCLACPLKRQDGFTARTPDMPASGSEQPRVYMLGEAPGEEEDGEGVAFVGKAGRYLRERIPSQWRRDLRWSNVVRTRPKGNATPDDTAIECCRPSVERDIAASQPDAIFGFGAIPLKWALRRPKIGDWTGRQVPVEIGGHPCWFFPLYHPSYIVRLSGQARDNEDMRKAYEQAKFVFDLHLKRAFAAVANDLHVPVVHTHEDAEHDIELLRSPESVAGALQWIAANEPIVGIDIETHKTRPQDAESRLLSVALSGAGCTVAFPIGHPEAGWSDTEADEVWEALLDFLLNAPCRKVQFTPFEMEWLAERTERDILWSKWADAQGQAYLLDAREGTLSLDFLCLQYFGLDVKALSNLDRNDLINTPLDKVLKYNAIDARYHRLLYLKQAARIKREGLEAVWEHHNRRCAAVVATQLNGVPINPDTVQAFDGKYRDTLRDLEAEIDADERVRKFSNNSHRFRPSAAADIKKVLLGLNTTQEEELTELADPLARLIVRWKHAAKTHSTYVAPALAGHARCAIGRDGRLHPALLLNRVRTWRTSSEGPNIQNYPKHGEQVEVRAQVEAPPGHSIVSFDYGQIQARNVAQESQDEALVNSMWDRRDIYVEWRDRVLSWYPQWVSRKQRDDKALKVLRQTTKGAVLGRLFGAGGRKLSEHLGVPVEVGYRFVEEFNANFPGVADWQAGLHAFYQKHGYVTGLSGFRRYAPVAHTEIINTPIQSDEAIIVLDAHIRLAETREPHFAPNMEIHDSLDFIWPSKKVDEYAEFVIDTMLNSPFEWAHRVPIVVEMSVGKVWSKMQEAGVYESDKWKDGATYKRVT